VANDDIHSAGYVSRWNAVGLDEAMVYIPLSEVQPAMHKNDGNLSARSLRSSTLSTIGSSNLSKSQQDLDDDFHDYERVSLTNVAVRKISPEKLQDNCAGVTCAWTMRPPAYKYVS
jgi:hypothetical protein